MDHRYTEDIEEEDIKYKSASFGELVDGSVSYMK